jgi:hypothetical protein
MLVITGFFENERFIPDSPISIPQNKKVIVTIEDCTSEEKTEQPVKHFSEAEKDHIRKSLFGILPSNIDLDKEREERLA